MQNEIAVFGGGCFWCTEAVFKDLKGVSSVLPGYAGGSVPNPTYEQVSSGRTGHAEVVKVEFDASVVPYEVLLDIFFAFHDPTTLNRQGADEGTQYRSVIFYSSEEQKQTAESYIKKLTDEKVVNNPIVTTIDPLTEVYIAEDYHKNYYELNKDKPYCQVVINPKIKKLREHYSQYLKA
jgi:peptide-methionine (S)-S-oxide reductase